MLKEIRTGPACDEIPWIQESLNVDKQSINAADNLLLQFVEQATELISEKHGAQDTPPLVASAIRRFDSRLRLEAVKELAAVPGLEQCIANFQEQLSRLPKAA